MAANAPMVRSQFEPFPPPPGEVVVQIAGCGVCHTDLGYFYDGVRLNHALPLALGAPSPGWAGTPLFPPAGLDMTAADPSTRPGDGLELRGAYVAAAVRCAPPANAPTPEERDRCAPFLHRELALLADARVIVALGAFGWKAALRAVEATCGRLTRPLPRFRHAAEAAAGPYALLGTFHPSQQNTFTGRLTAEMLDAVLARAVQVASAE